MKFLTTLSLLLITGCNISTSSVINIGELIERSNGTYVVHANCKSELGTGSGIISDESGGSKVYIQTRCNGYGKLRVSKVGVDVQVLSFIPIQKLESVDVIGEPIKTPAGVYSNTSRGIHWHDVKDNNIIYK
jgi:hypothetical protein